MDLPIVIFSPILAISATSVSSTVKPLFIFAFFWNPKTLPKTKTRKRRVRTRSESDWRDYYGSSEKVKSLVEEKGRENFQKIILRLCKTKGQMSYFETKLQFEKDVLLNDEYYNEFIGCKIHAKHLGGING